MSRTGNCLDNAPCESFFGPLMTALVHDAEFVLRSQARRANFENLKVYYIRQRLHSALDSLSPADFERANLARPSFH